MKSYMREALGPIRNRKISQKFPQNRNTGRKITQNGKTAKNNDKAQIRNFQSLNP